MKAKRPFGITFIGYFYIFGALVLFVTIFINSADKFGMATRMGLPTLPENMVRLLVSIASFIIAYGYLKLKKWGYWVMIIYSFYFLATSLVLYSQHKDQLFYGNIVWSIIVLISVVLH